MTNAKLIKQIVLVFYAVISCSFLLFGQDSITEPMEFRNEIGMNAGFGEWLTPKKISINESVFPAFFPNKSELGTMIHQTNSYISIASAQLYYTRWSKSLGKNNPKKNGLGFLLAMNNGYTFNEYWTNQTRITFDSVTAQNSGITYPVDSVNHRFCDKETRMNFVQLGVAGYRSNQLGEHLCLQFGLKTLANVKVKEISSFQFSRLTTIETYDQHYSVSKDSAVLVNEATYRTNSKLFAIDISFPVSMNYSINLIFNKRKSEEERAFIVPLHFGLEPVFNFTFLNNTCYTKFDVCYFFGISTRF